ncbi:MULTISPECIES: TraR/DksA C4-type zinc finger protein [unclassified Porphyromonas]|uniref:TraR/DksA family transcriptional regulator n=1 Tax=unclassified Porphyromonas TaxID=2645799 RepID=UPI00052DFB9C|nr:MULTISPECIES: TraR/DksA C4-type zinc finger protein [unclassified Porphyromonas]KGN85820.1 molecular chaperone DnaK [Porphyromonas sp. COT-290 OH860]KGO00321.1 molecular chaperone DnaK [Porphyromonas sp. COT-290 OH3588]MDO4692627.1 TraR/DksA C4-type zinc finger protein [Porphyromonadaceae bacterium]
MSTEKLAYTDEELQEFKELILSKLEQATKDYEELRRGAVSSGNDVADTSPTFKSLQESAANLSRGESGRMAERLLKFIQGLQGALVRIENKTYGICRQTGKLIPKERLRAVPHTTLSIEAKLGEQKK